MGRFVAPPFPQYKVEVLVPQNNFKKNAAAGRIPLNFVLGERGIKHPLKKES